MIDGSYIQIEDEAMLKNFFRDSDTKLVALEQTDNNLNKLVRLCSTDYVITKGLSADKPSSLEVRINRVDIGETHIVVENFEALFSYLEELKGMLIPYVSIGLKYSPRFNVVIEDE
jgi:hypothetical protein